MKRIITLFFAAMLAGQAWAEDFIIDNLKYTVTDAEKHEVSVGIISFDNPPEGDLVIPAEVENEGVIYAVVSIGWSAFYGSSNLTSITIPKSIKNIGRGAFSACYKLESINVVNDNNSFYSVDGVLFDKSKKTLLRYPSAKTGTTYIIPDGIIGIGDMAFYDSDLTTIILPESVTSIGEISFMYCWDLESITIPKGVISIEPDAFDDCAIAAFNVVEDNPEFSSVDGILFNKDKTVIVRYPPQKTNATYTLPNGVLRIGNNAFCDCRELTSVIIPNGITSIGQYAFSGCDGLSTIEIPNSVTEIGMLAFQFCDGLTTFEIPNSITEIRMQTFDNCWNLTSVTIPNSVTKINETAFCECRNLKTVSFNTNAIGTVFAGNASIEEVIAGDLVTIIPDGAFLGCYNIKTIKIPETVKIGKDVFGCKGTCGDDAYWKYDIFTKTMTISGTGFLKHYGYDFNTQTDIKTPWADFADIIESVVVEEGIDGLGACAFNNCANIRSVSLSSTCTDYGGSAFDNCPKLQKVAVKGKYVMRVNDHCFSNYENCTLYVPMDRVDYYKNEIVFKDFSKIIGAYMVTIDNVANGTISVDSSAILPGGSFTITVSPNEGYRINSVLVNGNAIEKNDTAYLVENVNENLTVSATFSLLKSGKCGENLTWKYDSENQTLTISGTGDMYDYEEDKTPWSTLKDKLEISTIVIEDGVTSIGDNAFGCVKATVIEVGATVRKLGKNNFMNYYRERSGSVTTTTYFSSYVYIYGTEIVDIDDAFSDTFLGGLGTIYVPIKNYAQITDSKLFEGYDIKGLCTITVADSIVNGSISVAKTCIAGNTIDITIMPKTGFKIESVTADGKPIEPSNKRYSLVVDSNIVLSATFKPIEYQISTYSSYGKITVTETAHYGDTVSFTVEPDKGYKVLYTSVSDGNYRDVDMINDSMFVMPAKDVHIAITFEKEKEKETDHTAVAESAATAVNIYATDNKIVVENATDDIYVYNAMGKLVDRVAANADRTEIQIDMTGVYVVKTNNTAKRVMIN